MIDKLAGLFQLEPERAHPGLVVNFQQIVCLRQLPDRTAFLARPYSFTPPHKLTTPSVRRGVKKDAKIALGGIQILPARIKLQIRIQHSCR
ncbi:MAG: hypothetical protein WAX69_06590 [Victivallales bacterium]